jgi:hypothetical protein
MNWNYWLPWRDYPQDGTKDSTYEREVIERCDHSWGDWTKIEDATSFVAEGYVEWDHLVFDIITDKARFCTECGHRGPVRRVADGSVALEIDYKIEDGVPLGTALPELEDEDNGSGRILVNQSNDTEDDGPPLVPVVEEPQAEDKPVKAGGATD